ncbi:MULTISPECIES: hypothetical protein [unclassified Bartonella]|uniref:hypothetical protein n=1 Tax=unclassified Bartonella TaxID=2645622 RepID=UPI00235FA7B6|nr:hypothetical protein [Bartonella sp. CM31XJBT]
MEITKFDASEYFNTPKDFKILLEDAFIGVKNFTDMSYKQAKIALFSLKKKQCSQMNQAQ